MADFFYDESCNAVAWSNNALSDLTYKVIAFL